MNTKQTVAALLTAVALAACGAQATPVLTPAEKYATEVKALLVEYGKQLDNAEMIDLGQKTCKTVRQYGYEEGKVALSADPFVSKFYEIAVRNLCPELMSAQPKY